jgi:hypothetical protein
MNPVDSKEDINDPTTDQKDDESQKKRRRRRRRKSNSSDNAVSDVDSNTSDGGLKVTSEGKEEGKGEENKDDALPPLTKEEIHSLFLGDHSIKKHLDALRRDRAKYLDQIRLFVRYRVIGQMSTSTKSKMLCALLIRNERDTAKWLMALSQYFSVGEIAKCIQLLDAPRKARQIRRKLTRLEAMKAENSKAVKNKTLSALRTSIHNLELEPHGGALNGSKCRMFLQWIRSIPKERLEFFLLSFGPENWRQICDLVHPSPSKDFKCDYFQRAVFEGLDDEKLPENCLVRRAQSATTENIVELLQQFPYLSECYSFLRKRLLPSAEQEDAGHGTESKVRSLVSLGFRATKRCAL